MSGARIAVSLGFRCGECQLNNCKAQRLIVQKQVSKFKTLMIRTRPVPSPLPEANPGKVPYSTLLKFPTETRTLQSSCSSSYETFAGETEQPWVHPIHCTMNRSQCLLIQGIQPWDFWWNWAQFLLQLRHFLCNRHHRHPPRTAGQPLLPAFFVLLQLFKNYVQISLEHGNNYI